MSKDAVLIRVCIIVGLAAGAVGCSPDVKLEDLQSNATGALTAIPAAATALVPKVVKPPVGSATEVYRRVAHGAVTCWLGVHGGMRATHLFQADAKPPSEGGAAQIDIHERLNDKPNFPGRKVFAVSIKPVGENASVSSENLGFPESKGDAMKSDVERWAANEQGCLQEPITEGWEIPKPAASGDSASKVVGTKKSKP